MGYIPAKKTKRVEFLKEAKGETLLLDSIGGSLVFLKDTNGRLQII